MNTLWPRLATLPTTNAMLTLVMVLWAMTCVGAIADSVSTAVAVPDRWYQALEMFTGIAVVQFAAKRGTHSGLWGRDQAAKKEQPSG